MEISPRFPSSLLWHFVLRHPMLIGVTVALRCLWEIVPMGLPVLVGCMVDILASPQDSEPAAMLGITQVSLPMILAAMLGLAFFAGSIAAAQTLSTALSGRGLVSDARKRLSRAMLGAEWHIVSRRSAGSWLTLINNDCATLRGLLNKVLVRSVTSVIRIAGPLTGMLAMSAKLTFVTLSIWIIPALLIWRLQARMRRLAVQQAGLNERLAQRIKESIDGGEAVRGVSGDRRKGTFYFYSVQCSCRISFGGLVFGDNQSNGPSVQRVQAPSRDVGTRCMTFMGLGASPL